MFIVTNGAAVEAVGEGHDGEGRAPGARVVQTLVKDVLRRELTAPLAALKRDAEGDQRVTQVIVVILLPS